MPEHAHDRSIRRLSRFLALATLIGMVLVPVLGLGVWFWPGLAAALGELPGRHWLGGGTLDWFVFQIRLGAAGISLIGVLITVIVRLTVLIRSVVPSFLCFWMDF